MYKIEAIIREEKLEDIKAALHEIEINGAIQLIRSWFWCAAGV